jgi:hypothetical protein
MEYEAKQLILREIEGESLVSRLDALNRTSNQSTEGLRLSNLRMIP